MNVVETYIKYLGGMIIVLSGLSGSGKTSLAKQISRDFNIKLVEQFSYYKKDYTTKATLPGGKEVINWDSDDAIDWDRFNKEMQEQRKEGVVIAGMSFPEDKIKFQIDFHIHLQMPKQMTLERRRAYLTKHKDKYPEAYAEIESDLDKLKMNKLTFPYYLEIKDKMKIHRYINTTTINEDQVYDQVFEYVVEFSKKLLDKKFEAKEIKLDEGDEKKMLAAMKSKKPSRQMSRSESSYSSSSKSKDDDDSSICDSPDSPSDEPPLKYNQPGSWYINPFQYGLAGGISYQ